MKKSTITQAVILSGGKGERLMPLTARMNKGMVRVAGKPFLEHLLELFKKNGIRRFLILTGHAAESITDYFGDGKKWGVEIFYQWASSEVNHGKRLVLALPFLDDFFLLHKNDVYWPFDLKRHLARFEAAGLPALLTVYINKNKDGIYGPLNNIHLNTIGEVRCYDYPLSPSPFYQGQDIGFCLFKKQTLVENLPHSLTDDFCLHNDLLHGLAKKGFLSAFKTDTPATTTTDAAWLVKAEAYFKRLFQKSKRH